MEQDQFSMTSTPLLHGNRTHFEDGNGVRSHQDNWLLLCESVSLGIIIITSLVANTVAIGTILRLRSLRNVPHHLLVLNLSVADLGITLTSMPFALYSIFDDGVLLQNNSILCKVNGFFATLFTLANFPTVLAIAIDRFLIVVYSSRFPPNRFRIFIMIAFSWSSAFLMAFMPAVDVLSEYSYSLNTWHCSPRWDHNIFRIVCAISIFGLAIPMVAVCYAAIVYFIWTKQKLLRSYSKREYSAYKDRRRMSRSKRQSMPSGYNSAMVSQQLPTSPTDQSAADDQKFQSGSQPGCQPGCQTLDQSHGQIQLNKQNKINLSQDKRQEPHQQQPNAQGDAIDNKVSLESEKMEIIYNLEQKSYCIKAGSMDTLATTAIANKSRTQSAVPVPSWEDSDFVGQDRDQNRQREVRQSQLSVDKRVAIMGALLVLTTLICWMPYLLVHSNYIRVGEGHWFGVFTMLLGYTNAIWDPLIYTFINKRARKECKKYFGYIAPFSRRSMNGSVVKQN
eukprot:XP_011681379.1 PREDICTED: tyramine receptor 1 [Strongylocentrotus purpuratus]